MPPSSSVRRRSLRQLKRLRSRRDDTAPGAHSCRECPRPVQWNMPRAAHMALAAIACRMPSSLRFSLPVMDSALAMFARRSLQRLLDELKGKVSLEGRTKLAFEMDRQDASALGYEWELVLIYALSRVGSVDYEASFSGGTRRPDISFCFCEQGSALRRRCHNDFGCRSRRAKPCQNIFAIVAQIEAQVRLERKLATPDRSRNPRPELPESEGAIETSQNIRDGLVSRTACRAAVSTNI